MWLFLKFEVCCWVSDDLGNMTLLIDLFIIVSVVEELGICMGDNVCDFVIFR